MKPRLLWASPLPPIRSGVSDYAVEILGPLSELASIRVVSPPSLDLQVELPSGLDVEVVDAETRPDSDEISLVHIGNNPYHEWLLERCPLPRTVIVTHDLVLHHLLVENTVGKGDLESFAEKIETAHGPAGRILAEGRSFGLHGRLDPFLFPALKGVLPETPLGFITHSKWAESLLQGQFPGVPTLNLKLPAADPLPLDRTEIRRSMAVGEDEFLIMHLGFPTPQKGMNLVLAGLSAAIHSGLQARLILVGERRSDSAFGEAVAALGLEERVGFTGWLDWDEMIRTPAAADLGIVLRTPSAGETSAAVVRFLACGTPTAVIGQRQFLEWDVTAAPRITPGPSAAAEVARVALRLAAESDDRTRQSARQAYESGHTPEQAAGDIVRFLNSL